MKASGMEYVEISLDGPDAATHDAFRGVPGAFERACAGVRACVDAGLFTSVAASGCNGGMALGHFYYGGHVPDRTRALAEFIGGCGAGRLYCSIEPTGDVQPCVFMPIRVGNIREQRFLDIWHTSPVLAEGCGSCGSRYICGGCRARAWAYFGDLTAPDPGCIHNRDRWEALQRRRSQAPVPERGHGPIPAR